MTDNFPIEIFLRENQQRLNNIESNKPFNNIVAGFGQGLGQGIQQDIVNRANQANIDKQNEQSFFTDLLKSKGYELYKVDDNGEHQPLSLSETAVIVKGLRKGVSIPPNVYVKNKELNNVTKTIITPENIDFIESQMPYLKGTLKIGQAINIPTGTQTAMTSAGNRTDYQAQQFKNQKELENIKQNNRLRLNSLQEKYSNNRTKINGIIALQKQLSAIDEDIFSSDIVKAQRYAEISNKIDQLTKIGDIQATQTKPTPQPISTPQAINTTVPQKTILPAILSQKGITLDQVKQTAKKRNMTEQQIIDLLTKKLQG